MAAGRKVLGAWPQISQELAFELRKPGPSVYERITVGSARARIGHKIFVDVLHGLAGQPEQSLIRLPGASRHALPQSLECRGRVLLEADSRVRRTDPRFPRRAHVR